MFTLSKKYIEPETRNIKFYKLKIHMNNLIKPI